MLQKYTAVEACRLYMNVKNHFKNDKFNMFTTKKGVRYSEANFEKRPDKTFFYNLSMDYAKGDLAYYYMCNIMSGIEHPAQMKDVFYSDWKAKMHSLHGVLEQDCRLIKEQSIAFNVKFGDLFKSTDGSLPIAVQLMNGNHITIDTIVIMNRLTSGEVLRVFDDQIRDTFVWPAIRKRIVKYEPWIERYFKEEKFLQILKNYL